MKRKILYITTPFLFIWILFSSVGCEMESHSKEIDGNWHLEQIDTLATGGSLDVRESRIFWGIQANLVQLRSNTEYENIFILRFNMNDDTLLLYEPHFSNRETHDPEVTNTMFLNHFGINELQESFLIEKLSTSKMILKSAKLRLYFEKF